MAKTVELIIDGKSYTLPVIEGSENEMAIDISDLRDQTGYVTLDVGYKNTGATKIIARRAAGKSGTRTWRILL